MGRGRRQLRLLWRRCPRPGHSHFCDSIMSMTRDAQKEANELRKAEIAANTKSFEQMALAVSRIEGMKADPVAAAFKALKPFALKAGLYTAGAASEFIEEAGGVKAALVRRSALGGGGKSEMFDKILQTIGAVAPALGGGGGRRSRPAAHSDSERSEEMRAGRHTTVRDQGESSLSSASIRSWRDMPNPASE